ncbi:MAG: hypothetical protein ACKVS8_11270 [Phycisphaerales bacterium]
MQVRSRLVPALLALNVGLGLAGSVETRAHAGLEASTFSAVSLHLAFLAAAEREVQTALIQAGLVPDALTAVGMTPSQVSTVAANVRTAILDGLEVPRVTDEALRSLQATATTLEAKARRGLASSEDLQQLGSLRTQIATTVAAFASAVAAVRTAAGVSADTAAALQRIQTNRRYDLSADYLPDTRDEATLVALREAATQVAQTPGGEIAPEAARSAVLSADGQAGASTAKVNREANATANDAAWRNAVGQ